MHSSETYYEITLFHQSGHMPVMTKRKGITEIGEFLDELYIRIRDLRHEDGCLMWFLREERDRNLLTRLRKTEERDSGFGETMGTIKENKHFQGRISPSLKD